MIELFLIETLDYGTLILDNSNLSDNPDRVNDSAPLTMNGGNFTFYGRTGTMSSETVGIVTLSSGSSIISAEVGNGASAFGPQSAILTLSGLVHNSGSTVEFSQNYINGSAGQLGTLGSNQESIIVTGGVPLTNNIIGSWAPLILAGSCSS